MAKRKRDEVGEELHKFRQTVNRGLLERIKDKLDELREGPEAGHALEDLAEPVPREEETAE